MSSDLLKIMAVDGVQCAVEFNLEGQLIKKEGNVDDRLANMLADLFSANLRMASMQAHLFTEESGAHGFGSELTGFAMTGPELSMCVIERVGIIVENSKADFNKIYEALASI